MASYLITGCSRGIGLEVVKLLSASPVSATRIVFATARRLSPALATAIESSSGRVEFVPLDVTSDASVADAVQAVTARLGPGRGLDVLLNNAGIQVLEDGGVGQLHGLAETLAVNVVGVQRVSAAFLPLLAVGAARKLVVLSSDLGSIGTAGAPHATTAAFASYKVSKAAVNMLATQWALELGPRGFTVFLLNPGWLRTDLGGPHAMLEPVVGARQVVDIIARATPADNGAFRSIHVPGHAYYDGKNLPW